MYLTSIYLTKTKIYLTRAFSLTARTAAVSPKHGINTALIGAKRDLTMTNAQKILSSVSTKRKYEQAA